MRNEVVGFDKPYDERKNVFLEDPIVAPSTVVTERVLENGYAEQAVAEKPVETLKRKKGKRLNPDAVPVLATAVGLVSLLMASSFAVSFSGIYDVSAWTGIPQIIQWLPALFIDAAILAYTISLIVFKARGESVWRTLMGLGGFALVSVVANVAHTVSFWQGSLADFRAWIGVLITASAPIAVLLASEEITRLAFESVDD